MQVLPHNAGVRLPALPGGLITRPTLVWDVAAQRAGKHRSRVSYQTQGITWWADYNVVYAEGATRMPAGSTSAHGSASSTNRVQAIRIQS